MTLPEIPVIEGAKDPYQLFEQNRDGVFGMLEICYKTYTKTLMSILDKKSKAWLERSNAPYKDEMKALAENIGMPGAYMANLSYEWACTTAPVDDSDGNGVWLYRALDWPIKGMGDRIVVARHEGDAGHYWNMTYPGFLGMLQGLAPGRFSIAINQAPTPKTGMTHVGDWLRSKKITRDSKDIPATFLLRQVFEQCADYESAVTALRDTPLAVPAIFSIAGVNPGERCIIERDRKSAHVHTEQHCSIGNHWINDQWKGHPRPIKSPQRVADMSAKLEKGVKGNFDWLNGSILNDHTRLAFEANARTGDLIIQGYEADRQVTQKRVLKLA